MERLLAVSLLLCVSAVAADQLPYPLQLFYLAPNNVAVLPPNPVHSTRTSTGTSTSANVDEEMVEGEASQFHSQDGRGRALFGYTTPDQARIEARSEDGTVRGSYSYLDAWGKAVKVQYWDDGTGFHAAGNNLPGIYTDVPQPVQDTPEVQAAKQQHFQLFQQALASAAAAAPTDDHGDQNQKLDPVLEPEQESVVVESDDPGTLDDKELTRYPNLQMFPQNLFDPTHVHDANREAVIVDNPDITPETYGNSLRAAKTLDVKDAGAGAGVPVPGGFFYSFRYAVPMLVQVRTVEDGKKGEEKLPLHTAPAPAPASVSQKAALFGAIPVAAVHDAQVPPYLRNSVKNYQVMPLYIETPSMK